MRHFRRNHLKKDTLQITPEYGFERNDRQSVSALKFLRWYAHKHNLRVQHKASADGEKRLSYVDSKGRKRFLKLDGYVHNEPPTKSIAIEYNGCIVHGHECIENRDLPCPNGKSAARNRELTENRAKIIRENGLELRVYWECEVKQMLESDPEMRAYYSKLHNVGPIDGRDAFCGKFRSSLIYTVT